MPPACLQQKIYLPTCTAEEENRATQVGLGGVVESSYIEQYTNTNTDTKYACDTGQTRNKLLAQWEHAAERCWSLHLSQRCRRS
jgi:hypothetical protein